MNNYRNSRKNRFKSSNDRGFRKRNLNGHKSQNDFNSNSEFRHRNHVRNNQNAPKLIEKYNNLAREALSSGDKILSENYLQHADHFIRVLSLQENNKTSEASNVIEQNFEKNVENISSSKNETEKYLFNLKFDLGEKNNLYENNPEVVNKLSKRMIQVDNEIEKNARSPWLLN